MHSVSDRRPRGASEAVSIQHSDKMDPYSVRDNATNKGHTAWC